MKNNIYFRWFWASLSESQKKDYREMSLNQQKDWYISYLESNYGDRRPGCRVRFPKKEPPPPLSDEVEDEIFKSVVKKYSRTMKKLGNE